MSSARSTDPPPTVASPRALVTAGPTEEPIDAVRFLGNRSSGRMGVAIATALVDAGFETTLALGPTRVEAPVEPRLRVIRFRSSSDLETMLRSELPTADLVVMAAAVADFRPISTDSGKLRRGSEGLRLELVSVPDLLAATAPQRKAGACVVGFALEPRERLVDSAREKLVRKDLHAIVANPLETMDAPDIDATVFLRDGRVLSPDGPCAKELFARWLVSEVFAPAVRH